MQLELRLYWIRIKIGAMINLIDESSVFNEQLNSFPQSICTVSIFGTQSSGKSTLLNHVFSTGFPVLNTKLTRERCTKGVWYECCQEGYLVVDTEGFDSVERGLEEKVIERQFGMLCLAISDILIVNLWMNQIGRYEGAHCGVLRTIIRMSERIINPSQPITKKLFFVVKDCSQDADRSILKQELSNQIAAIIKSQSKKPTIKLTTQYVFMSHYLHRREQYQQQAKQLAELIQNTRPRRTALSGYRDNDRLVYVKELWKQITSSDMQLDMKSLEFALKGYSLERMKASALQFIENDYLTSIKATPTYVRLMQNLRKSIKQCWMRDKPVNISNKDIEELLQQMKPQCQSQMEKWFIQTGLKRQIENKLQEIEADLDKNINELDLKKKIALKQREATSWHGQMVKGLSEYNISSLTSTFSGKLEQSLSRFVHFQQHQFSLFHSNLQKALNQQMDHQMLNLKYNSKKFKQIIANQCKSVGYDMDSIDFTDVWSKVMSRVTDVIIIKKVEEQLRQFRNDKSLNLFGDNTSEIVQFHQKLQRRVIKFIRQGLNEFNTPECQQLPQQLFLSNLSNVVENSMQMALKAQRQRFKFSLVLCLLLMYFFYNNFVWLIGMIGMKKKRKKYWKMLYCITMIVLAIVIIWRKRSTWKWIIESMGGQSESNFRQKGVPGNKK